MKEELIIAVANVLEEWNPLGERAATISDLNGYHTEAIDILSSSHILKLPIKNTIDAVLSQAFSLDLDDNELIHYSELIEKLVNEQ